MISLLASPSVCVIDDEIEDYKYILQALNHLFVGSVHILGTSIEQLPSLPFRGIRLVFTDLHLTGLTGKDAASHTANVFRRVVHSECAPVVVVIWSKYAHDIADAGLPPQDADAETESDLFKRTLLESDVNYRGRLIFLEMAKPKPGERNPDIWSDEIKAQIIETLSGKDAVHALWTWESLVREGVQGVSDDLTALSRPPSGDELLEGMKKSMQLLVRAQGGSDISAETSPHHLSSVLSQLLVDQLDHSTGIQRLAGHGNWLSDSSASPEQDLIPPLNSYLLTMAASTTTNTFIPGTVYSGLDESLCDSLFGVKPGEIINLCFSPRRHQEGITDDARKALDRSDREEWKRAARPVLVEVSPACDVAQRVRRNALLIAGLILPSALRINAKTGDAFHTIPQFYLRWPIAEFEVQNVVMIFCSRYKTTIPINKVYGSLRPWFRFRELPTASLRNWHAGHASRIGYVSL